MGRPSRSRLRVGTLTAEAAVVLYLDTLEAAGRTLGTRKAYRLLLTQFEKSITPRSLFEADQLAVRDFLDAVPSPNTKATRWIVLRAFYDFALKRGLISSNPTEGMRKPKQRRRDYAPLTDEEFARIFGAADTLVQVLLLTLHQTGARVGEVLQIRAEHISLGEDGGTIDFPSRKGGEAGYAAFGAPLATVLRNWLPAHPGWLLPSPRWPEKPISYPSVYRKLNEAVRKAGLASRVSPHRLRHTFATNAVDSGWPMLALQKQLGHRDPGSTAVYYHPTRRGLLGIYKTHAG